MAGLKRLAHACHAEVTGIVIPSFIVSEEKQETVCPFSPKIHGSWLLIERFHKEHVTINHTMVSFSHFGKFVCKERSLFSENLYKTVSYFSNGW